MPACTLDVSLELVVSQGKREATQYIDTALAWPEFGSTQGSNMIHISRWDLNFVGSASTTPRHNLALHVGLISDR
jgi:hypothetical protein